MLDRWVVLVTILTREKRGETEIEEGVDEACMSDSEPGQKNFFIARNLIRNKPENKNFSIDRSSLKNREF